MRSIFETSISPDMSLGSNASRSELNFNGSSSFARIMECSDAASSSNAVSSSSDGTRIVSIFKSRVLIAANVAPLAFALSDLTALLII